MYTKPREFDSNFDVIGSLSQHSQDVIKNEPMFFNCSCEFAYENGGLITKEFISKLPDEYKSGVFDSRVHMLMPGWYPAIPGYHHDDVARAIDIPPGKHFLTAGQPDYDNQTMFPKHILALVNGDICPTHFAIGKTTPPIIFDAEEIIYKIWHNHIINEIKVGRLKEIKIPSNKLIAFDCNSFHTASSAIDSGWRWFGRVSINTKRCEKITNEIRKQVQIYLEYPMNGW